MDLDKTQGVSEDHDIEVLEDQLAQVRQSILSSTSESMAMAITLATEVK